MWIAVSRASPDVLKLQIVYTEEENHDHNPNPATKVAELGARYPERPYSSG